MLEAISKRVKNLLYYSNFSQLRKADQRDKQEKKIRAFLKPSVLIIDEIGYLNLDHQSAHYLFQFISRRYERGSIILTSHKGFGECGEMVGDPIIATAMLDWLFPHSGIFNLNGSSYRFREQQMGTQRQKD